MRRLPIRTWAAGLLTLAAFAAAPNRAGAQITVYPGAAANYPRTSYPVGRDWTPYYAPPQYYTVYDRRYPPSRYAVPAPRVSRPWAYDGWSRPGPSYYWPTGRGVPLAKPWLH